MISNQVKPHNINIDKSIVLAFQSAHQKYKLYLEEEKKKKEETEVEIKGSHIAADINKIKSKCKR